MLRYRACWRGATVLIGGRGVAPLVVWVSSCHSWDSEVTLLQLEVPRPRLSRAGRRFLGWRSEVVPLWNVGTPPVFLDSSCLGVPLPFAEGAPREAEAPGLLAGTELRREGPLEPRPPRVTSDIRRAASYLPPREPAGAPSAGRGLGPGRGRSAAPLFLGGRIPSGSQETSASLLQAVVPGFEISFLEVHSSHLESEKAVLWLLHLSGSENKNQTWEGSEGQGSCEKPDEFLSLTEIFPLTCLTCYIIQAASRSEYLVS